jgi:hypothetical protein
MGVSLCSRCLSFEGTSQYSFHHLQETGMADGAGRGTSSEWPESVDDIFWCLNSQHPQWLMGQGEAPQVNGLNLWTTLFDL